MSTPLQRQQSQADQSTLFEVGDDPPTEAKPSAPVQGRPRLRTAHRDQIVFRAAPLDDLIPDDPPARLVWDDVEGLDLRPVYDRIQAVERGPGRAPIDPKILRALGLYATIEGIGSARQRDALGRTHAASQWIVGEVSINYHTLSDFRWTTSPCSTIC
jgi:transposase